VDVLIVEDEAHLRESLQDFLEDEGFAVSTASNGAEALALLESEELPRLMILDLIMPVLSGNELFEQMKKDPRFSKIPVVVSTSDPSRAPPGVLAMKKPVNFDRLLGAVRQHCTGQA
jgi:two-component system, sensor histidine kinase and response regulator